MNGTMKVLCVVVPLLFLTACSVGTSNKTEDKQSQQNQSDKVAQGTAEAPKLGDPDGNEKTPKTEDPKTKEPKVQEPKVEEPQNPNPKTEEPKGEMVTKAVCVLASTEGSNVTGIIFFEQKGDKVEVTGKVVNLKPNSKHGFHIHQYGDLSSGDGKSTGGHFNPTNKKHGGPNDTERHVGDLGNLEADKEGVADLKMVDSVIQLNGPNSIIGRAIIVHAGEDDLTTQPTGDAGARAAAGVIGIAKGN